MEKIKHNRYKADSVTSHSIPRSGVDAVDENPRALLHPNERDAMFTYMQSISKTPLLTIEEEVELANKIKKGDPKAREKMIASNLRLVVKIARDYMNFGLPLMDLVSEGNIGLVKAIERFDPYKGGKLSTYASWWIKQSIKRALANHSKTIRVPVHLVDRISKMRRIIKDLTEKLGREPCDEEIGYAMEIPTNKIAHLKSISAQPRSLDAPVNEESDTSFGDLVGDENQSSPFEDLDTKMQNMDIQSVVNQLDPREAEIIKLRFGLDGSKAMTLEEVGEKFQVTRERIRQLQNDSIRKMRNLLTEINKQKSKEELHEELIQKKKMEVLQEFFQEHSN
ncbi:MAG: sigma-70 family RNA polymerase sigma factor [Verrucomicrobia bacterium]|nr:sigma-70 family RNA polymerase sigma factor [Verrucomicrobiota bacterium]